MRVFVIIILFFFLTGFTCMDEEKAYTDDIAKLLNSLEFSNVDVKLPYYEKDLLVSYYRERNYDAIIAEVSGGYKLVKSHVSTDLSFARSYVIGMSFFYKKRYEESVPYLLVSVKYDSPIQDYLYYILATSYYRGEDFSEAIKYFSLLKAHYPFFREMPKVIDMEASYYLSSGKASVLLKEYLPFFHRVNRKGGVDTRLINMGRYIESLSFFIARAYEEMGDYKSALFYYRKQLRVLSLLSYAREAVHNMRSSFYKAKLKRGDYLYLARYYFKKRNYREVIVLLDKAGSNLYSFSPLNRFRYVSMLFISHDSLGNTKLAYSLYDKHIVAFGSSNFYKSLDYFYSRSFRKRDYRKAYLSLQDIVMDSSHPKAREASRDIMSLLESRVSGSLSLSSDKVFSSSDLSSLFTRVISLGEFRLVERFFLLYLGRAKDYDFIFNVFSNIAYSSLRPYRRTIFFYWLGELSIKLGDRDGAVSFFRRSYLVHRRNYYSHLSRERLISLLGEEGKLFKEICLEENESYRSFLSSVSFKRRLSSLKTEYNFSSEGSLFFRKSFTFLLLGELSRGYVLFKEYLSTLSEDKRSYYLVSAKLFSELGLHQFMIAYVELLSDYLNGTVNSGKLVPFLSEKLYPTHYKELVFKESARYGIDPYLVMALIREESRFNSSALSVSGAVGLMQLLPSTAKWLLTFGSVSYKSLSSMDLYDEGVNISLGVKYLNFLFKRASILQSVAGYNGGPGRVRRLSRKVTGSNALLNEVHFIELIDITETRNYAKRVMNSYYMYKSIYPPK